MPLDLDRELLRLIVGTNDQRRRVGQALHHFYRTLVFWKDKGLSFFDATRAWSAAGAMMFDALATTLRELEPHARDEQLRAFVQRFLARLAEDLERGDHMLVPFLRGIEAAFPDVTAMMREEAADSRIYDLALAEALATVFAATARSARTEAVAALRATAYDVASGHGAPGGSGSRG